MSESSTLFVGLNGLMQSMDVALAFPGQEGESMRVGAVKGEFAAPDECLRKVLSLVYRLHGVLEAGPVGFVVWRHLEAVAMLAAPAPICAVVAQIDGSSGRNHNGFFWRHLWLQPLPSKAFPLTFTNVSKPLRRPTVAA